MRGRVLIEITHHKEFYGTNCNSEEYFTYQTYFHVKGKKLESLFCDVDKKKSEEALLSSIKGFLRSYQESNKILSLKYKIQPIKIKESTTHTKIKNSRPEANKMKDRLENLL